MPTTPTATTWKHTKRRKDLYTLLNLNPNEDKDRSQLDNDAILHAISEDPNASKRKYTFACWDNKISMCPLSQAMALSASPLVIRSLHNVFPDAVHTTDSRGWTALHYACRFNAPPEVVLFLVDANPYAMNTKAGTYTPLHLACINGMDAAGILAERCCYDSRSSSATTSALETKDRHGQTPLHHTCYHGRFSAEVVRTMLRCCPDAAKITDRYGWTPLHLTCIGIVSPVEVVGMVAEQYPHALTMKDVQGHTPCVLAQQRGQQSIVTLLSTLNAILCLDTSDEDVLVMLLECGGKEKTWSSFVSPIVHCRTAVVVRMGIPLPLMPILLGRIGQERRRVQTMFRIVREWMGLF